jgi:hypothetical protein
VLLHLLWLHTKQLLHTSIGNSSAKYGFLCILAAGGLISTHRQQQIKTIK